jgi:DNA-binding cell septation regulator SpoVG
MDAVVIRSIRKVDTDSAIKAFADIRVGPLTLTGFKVVEGKTGLFVSNPSRSYKSNDGKVQWRSTVRFSDSTEGDNLRREISDKILSAYEQK